MNTIWRIRFLIASAISFALLVTVFVGTKMLIRNLFPDYLSTHYDIIRIVK